MLCSGREYIRTDTIEDSTMTLNVFNTMSSHKEPFVPREEKKVRMYVCGVTVYDECHLGHARCYITFDIVKRYLEYKGYQVTYVRNVTDIDDKIIQKAQKADVSDLSQEVKNVTGKYYDSFKKHMQELNVLEPTREPKATEHIADIVHAVTTLIDKGFAYTVDGDVYFEVGKLPSYGKLSKRTLEDMLAGARVEINKNKRSPMDFALWKKAKEDEPSWESPWGKGRPGWHIECSVMSTKYLGTAFDIHGGGQDLIFPHHENEIAQAEAISGEQFVRYWVHNGFVTVNKEKMSKSLGNFFALKDIFKEYSGNVVRFFLMTKHYRSPIDFCDEELREAQKNIERIENCIARIVEIIEKDTVINVESTEKSTWINQFEEAMDDDFNTARAIAVVFDLRHELNKIMSGSGDQSMLRTGYSDLVLMLTILGVTYHVVEILKVLKDEEKSVDSLDEVLAKKELSESDVRDLIKMRNYARKNRVWDKADIIRDALGTRNISLQDEPDGTVYSIDKS